MEEYSQKLNIHNRKQKSFQYNFYAIGLLIFVFYLSTLHSFLYKSIELYTLFLIISIVVLILSNIIYNRGIKLSYIDCAWLLFLSVFVLNILYNGNIGFDRLFDIIMYSLGILFLILVKVDVENFALSLKLIKFIASIYALSAIFQYFNVDLYNSYILPLFTEHQQRTILILQNEGSFTGLLDQTAYLAGYIVSGIGILIFTWKLKKGKYAKIINLVTLFILSTGLIFASKRAHIIFTIISIFMTLIVTSQKKELVNKLSKILLIFIMIVFLVIILFFFIKPNVDSPLGKFSSETITTISGILTGEDVTSGRSLLYSYGWNLFSENIFTGIGWKNFIEVSEGLISAGGSHPHNIYLQLLTEIGIVGFVTFVIPLMFLYFSTFKVLLLVKEKEKSLLNGNYLVSLLQFSLFYQNFFILYGLTGNLLTDYNFLLMYFFTGAISFSVTLYVKKSTHLKKLGDISTD